VQTGDDRHFGGIPVKQIDYFSDDAGLLSHCDTVRIDIDHNRCFCGLGICLVGNGTCFFAYQEVACLDVLGEKYTTASAFRFLHGNRSDKSSAVQVRSIAANSVKHLMEVKTGRLFFLNSGFSATKFFLSSSIIGVVTQKSFQMRMAFLKSFKFV